MTLAICSKTFALTVAIALAAACKAPSNADSGLQTNLENNAKVKSAFDAYKAGPEHCKPEGNGKRVIVTGFGRFYDYSNITGILAMSMAKESFYPTSLKPSEDAAAPAPANVWKLGEDATVNGVKIKQRLQPLEIDGEAYEVCFIYLDVAWDLAGAIVVNEASLFTPDLIVMMGLNPNQPTTARFESAALNIASETEGFDNRGLKDNRPVAKPNDKIVAGSAEIKILADYEYGQKLDLSWDAAGLAAANAKLISAVKVVPPSGEAASPFAVEVGGPNENNNYICNNISFIVAAANSGRGVSLAGDTLSLPGLTHAAKVGFLHLPSWSGSNEAVVDGEAVFGWAKVLANTIAVSLADKAEVAPAD